MKTTFRNLKISNKLLDLDITDDVFKEAEAIYKKERNKKLDRELYYCILQPKYLLKISLNSNNGYQEDKIIDLKQRSGKDIDNARWFDVNDMRFNFAPKTEDVKNINYIKYTMNITTSDKTIFTSIDDYKKRIIQIVREANATTDTSPGIINPSLYSTTEALREFIGSLNWLYNTDMETKGIIEKKLDSLSRKFVGFNWPISLFFRVKDIADNRRLTVIGTFGRTRNYNYGYRNYGGYNRRSSSWTAYDVPHDNPAYNYIDEGTYASEITELIPGTIQFDSSVNSLPKSYDPIEYFIGRKKYDVLVFDQNMIDKANKKFMIKEAMDRNNEKKKEQVKLKINSRIKNIDKTPLKLNETIFTEKQIEYAGQILQSDKISIKDLLTKLYRYHHLDDINYDRAFEMFVSELIEKTMYYENIKINARIGDINVSLFQKRAKNKAGAPYAVYYVNDIRVNKDEFEPILQRAVCFEDEETYNNFLKQVSTCSLKIHGLLDRGIDVTVRNPLKHESIVMKLEMVRKNKRQHLKIGKKTFLIKNTPRIINLPKKDYLDDLIDVLLNPDNIEGITPDDLKELVIQARKAYTDAIEKSKELLENTIEKFNLEKTTVDTNKGRQTGYIVPGKVKTYFVSYENNRHTSDCGVYTYPDMNYVCIVDKTPNQQVGVDKFVNRIYALANDQLLAKQINTLNIQT